MSLAGIPGFVVGEDGRILPGGLLGQLGELVGERIDDKLQTIGDT